MGDYFANSVKMTKEIPKSPQLINMCYIRYNGKTPKYVIAIRNNKYLN